MTGAAQWVVELRGHPFDLEDLPELLYGSPLAVQKEGSGWILSPNLFFGMTDPNAVSDLAEARIRLLNGLLRCKTVDAGGIAMGQLKFIDELGTVNAYLSLNERIVCRARAKASLAVIRSGAVLSDDGIGRLTRHAQLGVGDPMAAG
jgi:hypothetical protein